MRVVGIDTHKASLAACLIDDVGLVVAEATFPNAPAGFAAGEAALEVPPQLCHCERLRTRRAGKSDPGDALAIARVTLREADLPPVRLADASREIGLLVEARDDLVAEATRIRNRRHADLVVLVPGYGAAAANLVAGVHRVAPIPASSGQVSRMRLNRGGNRQLNRALYSIAFAQVRTYPPAQAFVARKRAEGKSWREAIRALKRHLARIVFRLLSQASPVGA
jgi:transposase